MKAKERADIEMAIIDILRVSREAEEIKIGRDLTRIAGRLAGAFFNEEESMELYEKSFEPADR